MNDQALMNNRQRFMFIVWFFSSDRQFLLRHVNSFPTELETTFFFVTSDLNTYVKTRSMKITAFYFRFESASHFLLPALV